jgi:hypothetical protein
VIDILKMQKANLESQVKGSVLTPGDEGYEQSLKRWAGNWERRAGFVVLVECAEDISKTVWKRVY